MEPTTRELNIMIENLDKKFDEKFADMKEILLRVEEQTKKTNGRVTALEEKANRAEGSLATFKWLFGFVGLGTLLTVLKILLK